MDKLTAPLRGASWDVRFLFTVRCQHTATDAVSATRLFSIV